MHEQLRRGLDLLLHDLAVQGPVPDVRDESWTPAPVASAVLYARDGSGQGVNLTVVPDVDGLEAVKQLVQLADQVQEWAVEALWAEHRSTAWPPCPHHRDTHPLTARLRAGAAAWTCPATGATVAAVGSLT